MLGLSTMQNILLIAQIGIVLFSVEVNLCCTRCYGLFVIIPEDLEKFVDYTEFLLVFPHKIGNIDCFGNSIEMWKN